MMRSPLLLTALLLGACTEAATFTPTSNGGAPPATSGAGGLPPTPAATSGAAGSEPGGAGGQPQGGQAQGGQAQGGQAQGGQAQGGQAQGGQAGAASSACAPELGAENRAVVAAALDALFVDKQLSAIDQYWADPYLQHNPIAESGVAAFKSIMGSLVSSPSFSYERLRTLAECDLVVVHGRYSGTGVIFDMFRVKDGKLIEHWDSDAGQAEGADGTTENPPSPDTAANRALVLAANEHAKVHHVIADGSFVFTLSEGSQDGAACGFYDLFRLQEGQIVETWRSRRRVPSSTASGLPIF